jgi:hypothetical protein
LCRDHGADDDRFLPPAKAHAPQGRQVSAMTPPRPFRPCVRRSHSRWRKSNLRFLLLALLCACAVRACVRVRQVDQFRCGDGGHLQAEAHREVPRCARAQRTVRQGQTRLFLTPSI